MLPNQIAAAVLSVLVLGAGAVGAATMTGPLGVDAADLPQAAQDALQIQSTDERTVERDGEIDIAVDGNVTPGETVTLTATHDGEPVANAPVEVNGEDVGTTDANGTIDVTVPDEDEFEVEIEPDLEGETTVRLAEDDENETDEEDETDEAEESDDADESDDDDERTIDLAIDGNVSAGENVTVTATHNGTPVAGADVKVNGEEVGTTDANGTIDVTVPDEDEFEVEAEYDPTGKLKVVFADEDDESPLNVSVSGNVTPGETVTVTVSDDGTPVENATVSVNDEVVGTTDADGTLDVTIPADADEVEIEVESDDREGEWEHEFDEDDDDEEDDDEDADDDAESDDDDDDDEEDDADD